MSKIDMKPIDKKSIGKVDISEILGIVSVGMAALEMLEDLLPESAGNVEKVTEDIIKNFRILTKKVDQKDKKISKAIDNILVGLQFQDRNTQVMTNVASLLRSYKQLLTGIQDSIFGEHNISVDITQPAETVLSGIQISAIRAKFMEALAKAKIPHRGGNIQCVGEQYDSWEAEIF
jgi:nucleotidyltransferase/DNA polymerase involved in DNA repair